MLGVASGAGDRRGFWGENWLILLPVFTELPTPMSGEIRAAAGNGVLSLRTRWKWEISQLDRCVGRFPGGAGNHRARGNDYVIALKHKTYSDVQGCSFTRRACELNGKACYEELK